ncbi:MAG: D-alanine--D-alanine ligase [Alphaproteobacteria bacterium]
MSKHIAVVMGGWSTEREVSLVSGAAIADVLTVAGYKVTRVDADRALAETLTTLQPDVVFNALHGRWGEDGCIQGLLEVLGIPYTHSGVLASAVAMDKPMAKRVFHDAGLPVAAHVMARKDELFQADPLPRPFVVKPANEGSSVGVAVIDEGDNFTPDQPGPWHEFDELMVEAYVPGREVTCAVMGDRALGVLELEPTRGFYDYEAKYTEGVTRHMMPAPIDPSVYEQAREAALAAHQALGCRGITRTDFRYDDTAGEPGSLYLLETNTQPGMTPLSLVPEIAAHEGISFEQLAVWIVEDASCPR